MKVQFKSYIASVVVSFISFNVFAQNSIIKDQFLASDFNQELIQSFERSDFQLGGRLDGTLQEKMDQPQARLSFRSIDSGTLVQIYPSQSVTLDELSAILEKANINSKFARTSGALEGYLQNQDIERLSQEKKIGAIVQVQMSTDTGLETSEGDEAMQTDHFRRYSRLTGAGIKIGVISNSFDCRGGASASRGVDIPMNVSVLDEGPCSRLSPLEADEGRAMMEIAYDIAPSAEMIFSTGFGGVSSQISSIDKLLSQGVNLIVDDVNYYTEPWFQKGELHQKIQSVVESGVHYITSAGNINGRSSMMPFEAAPNQPIPALGQLHRWKDESGQSQTDFLTFNLSPGQTKSFLFQWADPWRVGGSSVGPQSDFALVVIDLSGRIVSIADIDNINAGIAFESVGLTNPTANTVFLAIGVFKRKGPDPKQIQILSTQGTFNSSAIRDTTSTIMGPKNNNFPIVVGASNYNTVLDSDFGSAEIAYYSSRGGHTLYFDEKGNSILEQPLKPDVVGPDSVATTFFGFDSDGDGKLNFRGTSAAAPHIAGLVSLLLEEDKNIRPDYMKSLLRNTIDMDDPLTEGFDTAFDWGTGFGFINGIGVFRQLIRPNLPPRVTVQRFIRVSKEDRDRVLSLIADVKDDGLPWDFDYSLESQWTFERGNSEGFEFVNSDLKPHELKLRFSKKGSYRFKFNVSDSDRSSDVTVVFRVD